MWLIYRICHFRTNVELCYSHEKKVKPNRKCKKVPAYILKRRQVLKYGVILSSVIFTLVFTIFEVLWGPIHWRDEQGTSNCS
jgi:hypothetical protein